MIADFTYAFGELGSIQPYIRLAGGAYFLSSSFESNADLGGGTGGAITVDDGDDKYKMYLGVQPQIGVMIPIGETIGVDANLGYNLIIGDDEDGDASTDNNNGNAAYIGFNLGVYYVFGE